MTTHTEIFAYEIAAENIDSFLTIKDRLIKEAGSLPGLTASATYRSQLDRTLFIDRMHWVSPDAAAQGNVLFQSLPNTAAFLALMAGPPRLAGPMDLIAGA